MRVRVDRECWVGAGWCLSAARGIVELDGAGRSRTVKPDLGNDRALREAVERCPTQAIVLEDRAGNRPNP
jgi:ferredoxin